MMLTSWNEGLQGVEQADSPEQYKLKEKVEEGCCKCKEGCTCEKYRSGHPALHQWTRGSVVHALSTPEQSASSP